ncbi:adenylate/guanylate cyclase domain-containing protein [candidate division CSSED10-310 bacterium]|uniref:Adenylate/guanylate cyclase domain-containing protein n=1 Tax=candidate division CSSED10-310 bacterium TaxID=2855610 RepID=A0ABV6Z0V3_UNCC1
MEVIPEVKDITVLYADFIGFNKLAKIFEPNDMMAFLNRLFQVMEAPINEFQGVIDKIVGDAIIVTFNAFEPVAQHQEDAVKTAIKIIDAVKAFSQEEEHKIELGIGIASGQASCGPVGTSTYHPPTVVGQVVGKAYQLSEKGCKQNLSTLYVDANVFHETISSFEYQQIEEDIFKVNIPLFP